MKHFNTLSLLFLCFAAWQTATAQNLPPTMHISADGRTLHTGDYTPEGLYDSSIVRTVYLNFPQSNYWSLLTSNYQSKTDLPAQMTVDNVTLDSVGVRFKGQTSYSNTQNSQKKSFNISTDAFLADQKLMGYQSMNLNNCFQDASFLREVFYLHQIRRHIPAAKANFVQLYINNQNWGLYPNVQQLNKDFLEEWFLSNDGINWRADRPTGTGGGPGGGPAWGDGTAAINYLGADTTEYQQYYTLKSSDKDNPWSYLVDACDALNNTPAANLTEVLPDYFDIDRILWHLATEIAFTDDDSYVFKGKMDYYVYYEPETGRMTLLEYDGNSAMETNLVNWSPFYNANKVNYPLLNKLLNVPVWRQRYLAHLRTIIAEEMDPQVCNSMLTNYQTMISPLVQADPKKLYSFTQFNSEVTVLKNFITNRRNVLLANAEVSQAGPIIASVNYYNTAGEAWAPPTDGQVANVSATVSSANGISAVQLYWSTGLTGNFTAVPMLDDGQHNDGAAADGVYGAAIPGQIAGSWVRFYVEAAANNAAKSVSYLPVGAEHDVFIYKVQANLASGPVVLNEIMASNTNTVTDETGDYEDWIELYNNSATAVNLGGYYLSDNPDNLAKYEIPAGISIPAHGYLIFWADEDGVDGPYHANFKLSAGGETVLLLNHNLEIVDSVSFGQQTPDMGLARVPNGTGNFVIQAPTFNANNSPTATESPEQSGPAFALLPNPVGSDVTIQIIGQQSGLPLVIRNLNGQTVTTLVPDSEKTVVTTTHWPAGVYAVTYGSQTQRLVVAH